MATKKKVDLVKWFNSSGLRPILGPEPNTLVFLNIFAFLVPHLHFDAGMRILHWYTTLGFCLVLLSSYSYLKKKFSILVLTLSISIILFTLPVNTWIAYNGMGVQYGRLFHLFMAIQFIFTYLALIDFKIKKNENF
tara:strand:- start:84 stop:491 length:408 start_codon:yes stop_codon:yes gene_type:complete